MSDERPSYRTMVEVAEADPHRYVTVERAGAIATVRMDDPATRNALSGPLTVQLLAALRELAADRDVRVVILTGGGGAFSAGGDLRMMLDTAHPMVDDGDDGAVDAWRWIRYQFGGVVRTIVESDKTFIAAVGGPAAGVGLAFALACDLIVAADSARLVLAFGPIGLVPEVGTSWLLTRRLGYARTFELYCSGRAVDAAEAHRLGLVNEVVAAGDEVARATAWAERILALPAHAVTMTKPLLRAVSDMTWHQAITLEEMTEPMCFTTRGHRDGVRATLERLHRR
jgi:2-(1,2-epoxy-1,2-dihydrophenyl)acetyl-CoA isomerase